MTLPELDGVRRSPGRPRSVAEQHYGTVFSLYSRGWGYRRIADALMALGAVTSKSSIERLVKGQGVYRGRRPRTDRLAVDSTASLAWPEGHA